MSAQSAQRGRYGSESAVFKGERRSRPGTISGIATGRPRTEASPRSQARGGRRGEPARFSRNFLDGKEAEGDEWQLGSQLRLSCGPCSAVTFSHLTTALSLFLSPRCKWFLLFGRLAPRTTSRRSTRSSQQPRQQTLRLKVCPPRSNSLPFLQYAGFMDICTQINLERLPSSLQLKMAMSRLSRRCWIEVRSHRRILCL